MRYVAFDVLAADGAGDMNATDEEPVVSGSAAELNDGAYRAGPQGAGRRSSSRGSS